MTTLHYPRLSRDRARQRIEQLLPLSQEERRRLSAAEFGSSSWYPTGQSRVSPQELNAFGAAVRAVTPAESSRKAYKSFDAAVTPVMRRHLRMMPAEAGVPEVWNYLSLVLLPDVTMWRWAPEALSPRARETRWLGGERNVFRRHWFRARVLGEDLVAQMTEDQLEQIFGRSASLGSDPRVARSFATAITLRRSSDPAAPPAEILTREASKRVVRLGALVSFPLLDDAQLTTAMDQIVDTTVSALR